MTTGGTLTIRLPDLIAICTFECATHPDGMRAAEDSIMWITSEEVLGANDKAKGESWANALSRQKIPLLAAYVYPYAPYDKLSLCCDVINMIAVMDEITDDVSGERAREIVDHHLRGLFGGHCDGSPISRMTTSIRDRAKSQLRPKSFVRFIENYREYMDAVVLEAELREKRIILPVEEYRVFRRESGAPRPCFDLIEACLNIELSDEVLENPVLRRMSNAACDMVMWSNDLYSYKKELIQDGPTCSNVITSLMNERCLFIQEAVDFVGTEFQLLQSLFLLDKKNLPSFGVEIDEEIKAYMKGLEYWIAAALRFQVGCTRYFDEEERQKCEGALIVRLPSKQYK